MSRRCDGWKINDGCRGIGRGAGRDNISRIGCYCQLWGFRDCRQDILSGQFLSEIAEKASHKYEKASQKQQRPPLVNLPTSFFEIKYRTARLNRTYARPQSEQTDEHSKDHDGGKDCANAHRMIIALNEIIQSPRNTGDELKKLLETNTYNTWWKLY